MADASAPDPLADRLARIYVAIGPVYRKAARIVEGNEGVNRMSVGVRAVLDELSREGALTVPQVAKSLELSRQFIQRMANDAHEAGLVEFTENPAHRRSRLLSLSERGREAIEAVQSREREVTGLVVGGLTVDDLDTTLRVLERMHEGMDALDREGGVPT